DHNMQELGAGFFLHDLGKCDVPLELINKAGRLSDEEWQLMRNHPREGNRLLSSANQLTKECGLIVMQHHEREDGTGYPFGLKKNDIHLYARICSIADVYDALTSTRAYKKKLPTFEALKVMREEMLQHFNKELFAQFVMIFKS
ncbi:MAG: HD domain-containing protein, partial [Fidelibacterota bacterium]